VRATGKKINQMIRACGFEVKDVSKYMGLSLQAIYKWQEGRTLPDVENLYILSRLLGCGVDDFIVGTDMGKGEDRPGAFERFRAYCVHMARLYSAQIA